jgi:hypothetical protein
MPCFGFVVDFGVLFEMRFVSFIFQIFLYF